MCVGVGVGHPLKKKNLWRLFINIKQGIGVAKACHDERRDVQGLSKISLQDVSFFNCRGVGV